MERYQLWTSMTCANWFRNGSLFAGSLTMMLSCNQMSARPLQWWDVALQDQIQPSSKCDSFIITAALDVSMASELINLVIFYIMFYSSELYSWRWLLTRAATVVLERLIRTNKITFYKQTKRKVLLRGSHMAHFLLSSCDLFTQCNFFPMYFITRCFGAEKRIWCHIIYGTHLSVQLRKWSKLCHCNQFSVTIMKQYGYMVVCLSVDVYIWS